MELPAPVPTIAAATTAPMPVHYPDSLDSSPRSRTTETYEGGTGSGDIVSPIPGGGKVRLMCSYGGHIVPRPHDKSLCYVGGDTRIVVVDRKSTLPELLQRLSRILLNGRPFTLKYQLPNEDLDSLITISSEEDLENMIDEYDRLTVGSNAAKPSRIRLFLFPAKLEVAASMGPILDGSNKSGDWFLNALNGADILHRGYSDPASVNCLLGLDKTDNSAQNSKEPEGQSVGREDRGIGLGGGKGKLGNMSNQDVHSIPDSPVVETTSSFGSTSSSPSLASLPPIRVHVEGARVFDQKIGIEEQFAQMGVVTVQKQEEGFAMMSSPPAVPPNLHVPCVAPGAAAGPAGEYNDQIVSDDERLDHGIPAGCQKPPQPQRVMLPTYQVQPKQMSGDLPSPDSAASDGSLFNAISHQRPALYQDPYGQNTSGSNRMPVSFIDPNTGAQIQSQQFPDSAYVLPSQHEQHQQQQVQPQQQTLPQQLIHASSHYVHPLSGGTPLSYYPVYPSQQPHNHHHIDQRYPVYYVPAGQAHAGYNMPVQQPNYGEAAKVVPASQPQNPPNPTYNARNVPPPKSEIAEAGGLYGTTTIVTPQLVQVPSHQHQQQHQFVGYSQINHASQSIAPTSAGPTTSYAYEIADPAHSQIYFTQPLAPQLASQYQTMASALTAGLSDASSAVLLTEPAKPQQMRSS